MSNFTKKAKATALAIVKIFETGKPLGDYSAVAVLNDGAGISYGTSQFTHKSGSLAKVLVRFQQLGGTLPTSAINALPNIKAKTSIAITAKNARLKADLKELGKNPIMRQAQMEIAFESYLNPALEACKGSGFVLPLSLAVIYDSINHGSYDLIRDKVRLTRSAYPNDLAFEKAWITEYTKKRDTWLESIPRLKSTAYRTDFFLAQIGRGNWQLNLPMLVHGRTLSEADISKLELIDDEQPSVVKEVLTTQNSAASGDLPDESVSKGNTETETVQSSQPDTPIQIEAQEVVVENVGEPIVGQFQNYATDTVKQQIPSIRKQVLTYIFPTGATGFVATVGTMLATDIAKGIAIGVFSVLALFVLVWFLKKYGDRLWVFVGKVTEINAEPRLNSVQLVSRKEAE